MTTINSSNASLSNAVTSLQSTLTAGSVTQSSEDVFGNAVNVTLSAPAQAALAAASGTAAGVSPASSGTTSSAPPPAKGGVHGGGAPQIAASTGSSATSSLVEAALRKVIPIIGVSAASEVVDKDGNISSAKLAEVIAQQEAKQAATATDIAA